MKMRISLGNVYARNLSMGGGAALAVAAVAGYPTKTLAAPYASNVQIAGTSVSFTLNEPADLLTVNVNGTPTVLDGSTAGTKTFTIPSASATFSINAQKTAASGYTVPTGVNQGSAGGGLSLATTQGGTSYIGGDTNAALLRFNSPRGISVSTNPNTTNFGIAYVSNSAASTAAIGNRAAAGDGIYALKGDLSDAFGYGNTAQAGFLQFGNSANSPYKIQVANDGNVYISDFSDANGQISRLNPTLTLSDQVLAGTGGTINSTTFNLPAGQNHGSTLAVHAYTGPTGLTVLTLDEDLTTGHVAGGTNTADYNTLWKYDIGNSALPYAAMPTKLNHLLVGIPTTTSPYNPTPIVSTSDIDRGADGKLYMSQSRANGGETGLYVLASDGSTVLFDSLAASRTLLANPTAKDILTNIMAVAVSPDQKFVAMMLNGSDVAVMPLVNGIPDLANRIIVDTGTDVVSGRDIAFDAADNIYYVSSGQQSMRVLAPGGFTSTTLTYDGSTYSFANAVGVPEPGSIACLGVGALALFRRGRRR